MLDKLILFPCNGNAIEALDCIDEKKYQVLGFVDDDKSKIGTSVLGYKVYSRDLLYEFQEAKILAIPGGPKSFKERDKIISNLKINNNRFTTIIHPNTSVSKFAKIGSNCLIMEGVIIKANSIIGDNVCILPNSVIHHDSKIGDNTLIGCMTAIAGEVTIGENCYIGSKTSIKNGVFISSKTLVGIGSNVVKDSIDNNIILGNPASPYVL